MVDPRFLLDAPDPEPHSAPLPPMTRFERPAIRLLGAGSRHGLCRSDDPALTGIVSPLSGQGSADLVPTIRPAWLKQGWNQETAMS